MKARIVAITALTLALAAGAGCISKSSTSQASSESSSDSSSSSGSSSSSSTSSSPDRAYHNDVREATREWLLAGGDAESFKRQISQMAQAHGVTDWMGDQGTLEAIGRGIKLSGVRGERLENIKSTIAGMDAQAARWIQAGYEDEDAP